MKTIAFFSTVGGAGTTTLVYHLAWMFADMGLSVVAADLDPQSNLTSMFLEEDRLVDLWPAGNHPLTIQDVVEPVLRGSGDIQPPYVEGITDRIGLIVGDLGLAGFEDKLSEAWPQSHAGDESAFRVTTALYRAVTLAAERREAEIVVVDVGPNLGAINRSALIGCQHVVIPVAPGLFFLQGLRNLGPQLRAWRSAWRELLEKRPNPDLSLPTGDMQPVGYVVMRHASHYSRPVPVFPRWLGPISREYRESILGETPEDLKYDPHCLATLKDYRSLTPMAREARKPMFFLKPADGAIGAHGEAVRDCYKDFKVLAERILTAIEFRMAPDPT